MATARSPPSAQKHRKAASTGGGRAWSEAEEAFLIETRERKMPYKHIAAQLKKTELACRLHYHQLSFGSKSRQHNNSNHHSSKSDASSHSSSGSTPHPHHSSHHRSHSTHSQPRPHQHHDLKHQRPLPSFSPPSPSSPQSSSQQQSKPLLPKPHPITFSRASTDPPRHHPHAHSRPHSHSHHHPQHHPLRLQTSDLTPRSHTIDVTRLNNIYNTHRLHFWSVIAADYGGHLSPATLEDAWRRSWQPTSHSHHHHGAGGNFPPTPRGSPLSGSRTSIERDRESREPSVFATSYSAIGEMSKLGGGGLGGTWGERGNSGARSAFPGHGHSHSLSQSHGHSVAAPRSATVAQSPSASFPPASAMALKVPALQPIASPPLSVPRQQNEGENTTETKPESVRGITPASSTSASSSTATPAQTTTTSSTSRGLFSVGSLLTEDRDVRSPSASSGGSSSERGTGGAFARFHAPATSTAAPPPPPVKADVEMRDVRENCSTTIATTSSSSLRSSPTEMAGRERELATVIEGVA